MGERVQDTRYGRAVEIEPGLWAWAGRGGGGWRWHESTWMLQRRGRPGGPLHFIAEPQSLAEALA